MNSNINYNLETKISMIISRFNPPDLYHQKLIYKTIQESICTYIVVLYKQNDILPCNLKCKFIQEWINEIPHKYTTRIESVNEDHINEYNKNEQCHFNFDEMTSESLTNLCRELIGYVPDYIHTPQSNESYIKDCNKLPTNVRSYYVPRIILVGSESTGKSTLAERLKNKYNMPVIPEYCRIVAENKNQPIDEWTWTSNEFIQIANEHIKAELDTIKDNPDIKFLICDNDSFSSSIWNERYCGKVSNEIENIYKAYDQTVYTQIYLLTKVDVPFVQDGFRDGEDIREWMYQRFVDKLTECKKEYYILAGDYDTKYQTVCHIIDSIINAD